MTVRFEIKCYPGTKSENVLTVEVGNMGEIFPEDTNYDPLRTYGYRITTSRKGTSGFAHLGIDDMLTAEANAMLRAVSYGNGGFPLESRMSR